MELAANMRARGSGEEGEKASFAVVMSSWLKGLIFVRWKLVRHVIDMR